MGFIYTAKGVYEPLENHPKIQQAKLLIELDTTRECEIQQGGLRVTELGKQFAKVCVSR
ncbi:hypothetical protein D3C77_791420 [compost metagenome]